MLWIILLGLHLIDAVRIQTNQVTNYGTIYSAVTASQGYISVTFSLRDLAQPYQYPILQLCDRLDCTGNKYTDNQAYQSGQPIQYVSQPQIAGSMWWYRIISDSGRTIGAQNFSLFIDVDSFKDCSPLCTSLGNTCSLGRCKCSAKNTVGNSCQFELFQTSLQRLGSKVFPNTGYLQSLHVVLSPSQSSQVKKLQLRADFDGAINIYTKKVSSNSIVPGNLFSNDLLSVIVQSGSVDLTTDNFLTTIVSIQKQSLDESGVLSLIFRTSATGLSVWVIILIVLSVAFGLISLGCICYHLCKKNQDIRPITEQDQVSSLNKYFPEIKYSTLKGLMSQQGTYNATAGDECIICIEEFKETDMVRVLYCQHYFHSHCLREWFKKNKNCPYCREEHSLEKLPKLQADHHINGTESAEAIVRAIMAKHKETIITGKENKELDA